MSNTYQNYLRIRESAAARMLGLYFVGDNLLPFVAGQTPFSVVLELGLK